MQTPFIEVMLFGSKGIDGATVAVLRSQGVSWRAIAEKLGVGVGTLYRVAQVRPKTQERDFGTQHGVGL